MTSPRLRGLAPAIHYLSTFPSAPDVAEVLRTTVFGTLGARTCSIWRVLDGDLVAVAQVGHTQEQEERYRVLPAAIDLLIWRAVRTGTPIFTDGADTSARGNPRFASVDEEFWSRTLRHHEAVAVVRSGITYAGQPIGALGMILDQPWSEDAESLGVLDVVTSALGLWMSSPASGTREIAVAARASVSSIGLFFTERQRQILRMVEQDVPTAQIALSLRVSESSIKQDLQHVMMALNTRNRTVAATRARELGVL